MGGFEGVARADASDPATIALVSESKGRLEGDCSAGSPAGGRMVALGTDVDRNGRDGSGVFRGESGCSEGVDEADTNVSFDNELEDRRTRRAWLFSFPCDSTSGTVVVFARVRRCDVGSSTSLVEDAGIISSISDAILWDGVRLGCGDTIEVFA